MSMTALLMSPENAPRMGLEGYARSSAVLPDLPGVDDWRALGDPGETEAILAAVELPDSTVSEAEIAALVAFLEALTGEVARAGGGPLGVPEAVPSGLPVDR